MRGNFIMGTIQWRLKTEKPQGI